MKRNRLYTVNKWNKPAFIPNENLFYLGGNTMANLAIDAYNTASVRAEGAKNSGGTGLEKSNASIVKEDSNWLNDVGNWIGNNKNIIAGVGSALAPAVGGLISGDYESGIGTGISGVGDTAGKIVSNFNPVAGAVISAGSQILGGLANRAFGISTDEAALQAANAGISAYNNFNSNAGNFDDIRGPEAQANFRNPYSNGWFTSAADEKNERLKNQFLAAKSFAERSVDNNVNNLIGNQLANNMYNYAAYGGSLGLTPYGKKNIFDNGGDVESTFFDSFPSDPVGAAVRYNAGMEQLEEQRQAEMEQAARTTEFDAWKQNLENLRAQNMQLEAALSSMPSEAALTGIPGIEGGEETPPAARDYTNIRNFLKGSENFSKNAYTLPGESHPTIGWGFYEYYPGTNTRVKMGDTMSMKDADRYLDTLIKEKEMLLATKVPNWNKLSVNQKDALIDLAYNAGDYAPHFKKKSRLMRALANEDWDAASRELATSAKDPKLKKGLIKRSNRRRNMFLNGDYSIKAFGGELGTNGTDFTNGLLYVDAGGSHESNPMGGVLMGLDENGVPNLVEEGETVYNDYVFSDRMKVPAFMYNELGLGGSLKKGITFAEASKKLARESEQRPNDPISIDGLNASLAKLAEVQETERMRKEMEADAGLQEYACGGMMNKHAYGGNLYPDGGTKRQREKEELFSTLLGGPVDTEAWNKFKDTYGLAADLSYDDWDLSGVSDNEDFLKAVAAKNPALAHAIRGGYYSNYTPPAAARGQIFNESLGQWTTPKTEHWWGNWNPTNFEELLTNNGNDIRRLFNSEAWKDANWDPAFAELVANHYDDVAARDDMQGKSKKDIFNTVKDEIYKWDRPTFENKFRGTKSYKDTTEWLHTSDNALSYLGAVVDGWKSKKIPKQAADHALKFIEPDGKGGYKWKEKYKDNYKYEDVFGTEDAGVRGTIPGSYWKSSLPAVNKRNQKVINWLDKGDGNYTEILSDPGNYERIGNPYSFSTEDGDFVYNYYKAPMAAEEAAAIDAEAANPDANKPDLYPTWMRYAPLFGAGALTLTDALGLTNSPDYTYANRLEAAANAAGYAPNITYNPIGDYMKYSPFDRNYWANQLTANARATDRAINNVASPSRNAGLLANGYNTTLALGNLGRQGDEYNREQYERVKEFNRKTNMFNSQLGLEAAMANAKYTQQAKSLGLTGLGQAASIRDDIDQRVGGARALNLSNFLTSLGNLGRENFAMNQINSDRSRRYKGRLNGDSYYTAFGGKIKRRK